MIVADGFTGNVALKVMEGSSAALLGAVRDRRAVLLALEARRAAAAARSARDSRRALARGAGRRGAAGLRRLAVVPHGSFGARGFERAIEVAARGVREDVAGRTHARLQAAGALRKASDAAASVPERVMTRDEVLELIREHLADELELDPARIQESTHFREDLSADSLDLYTLVQELEDQYGVKMSDEEAARIHTVAQAIDFVLANDPSGP